jgi:hypothetical protein
MINSPLNPWPENAHRYVLDGHSDNYLERYRPGALRLVAAMRMRQDDVYILLTHLSRESKYIRLLTVRGVENISVRRLKRVEVAPPSWT